MCKKMALFTLDALPPCFTDYLALRHDHSTYTRQAEEKLAEVQSANERALKELRETRDLATQQIEVRRESCLFHTALFPSEPQEIKEAAVEEAKHYQTYSSNQARTQENDIRLLKVLDVSLCSS
jgi:hypothetical protein